MKGLEKLTNLSTLRLSGNQISERIFPQIGNSATKAVKYCQEQLEKKARIAAESKRQERLEAEKREMKEELEQVPNLRVLIRKFMFKQFRGVENALSGVSPNQVDSHVEDLLIKKIPLFFKAMESLGHAFNSFQKDLTFNMMYDETEAFRRDLHDLLVRREEEERLRREREEAQRKLDEQRKLTAEAFGEVIENIELVERIDGLKSVNEEIDNLLKQYENWDEGKKSN